MHAPLQESALGKLCFSIARTCSKMLAATPAVTACWLKLAMQGGEGTSSAAYTLPCLLTLSGQCIMLNCLCNFEPRWQVLGSSRVDTRLPQGKPFPERAFQAELLQGLETKDEAPVKAVVCTSCLYWCSTEQRRAAAGQQ